MTKLPHWWPDWRGETTAVRRRELSRPRKTTDHLHAPASGLRAEGVAGKPTEHVRTGNIRYVLKGLGQKPRIACSPVPTSTIFLAHLRAMALGARRMRPLKVQDRTLEAVSLRL